MSAHQMLQKARKLVKQGEANQAVALFGGFLQKHPKNAAVRQELARLVKEQEVPAPLLMRLKRGFVEGRLIEVHAQTLQLLERFPTSYSLWQLLGNALLKLRELEQARLAFEQAASQNPMASAPVVGLGDVCRADGQAEAALACCTKALHLNPRDLGALNNCGNLLDALRRPEEAAQCLDRARQLAPDNAVVWFNLGNIQHKLGRLEAAQDAFKSAVALQPELVQARYNLGLVQRLRGDLPAAVQSFENVIALDPTHDAARAELIHQMAHMCDWGWISQFRSAVSEGSLQGGGAMPFPCLAMEDDPLRQRQRSEAYARHAFAGIERATAWAAGLGADRIRVGYFSADFHDHATMYLMGGLFAHHDPAKVEVYVYSFGPSASDGVRARIVDHVAAFREVAELSDAEIARLARQDGLDIAVDLKGYTGDNRCRIFAHGAAPVQVSWLGYPGTMGAEAYDYVIADPVVLPLAQRGGFSECVIEMPHSYQINDNTRVIGARRFSRADCGLPETGFVFCCFNNSYKITPQEFDIWMRLLSQVDESVLWLLHSNEWAEAALKEAAKERGVDPSRLVFADRMNAQDHLARHHLADLCLDTFVVNAHTTASDALWCGVPMITRQGQQFAARVGASLLRAAGLPELITDSDADYEALALRLARNPQELARWRTKLEAVRDTCALFDTARFARHLEAAFATVTERWRAGQPPADVAVSP